MASPKTSFSPWVLIGAVAAVTVAVIAILIVRLRSPNLVSTANKLADCVTKKDAECLRQYVTEEELNILGVKSEYVDDLLKLACIGVQLPEEKEVALAESERHVEQRGSGVFTAIGREPGTGVVGFPMTVAYLDGGIGSPSLVSNLLIAGWRHDPRPVDAQNRGEAIFLRIRRGFDEDRNDLERFGVTGISYHGQPMTLDEFRDYCTQQIEESREPKPVSIDQTR